jgi:OOP family OmpA-OmpF porin
MKNILLTALLAISICSLAQTQEKRNFISFGGGRESYNGDLGNYWFKPKEEFYGFFRLSYARYLNKSFDVLFVGSKGDLGHCKESDDPETVLNYYSRMTSGIIAIKYKLANGYIFKEDARIAPYIFIGGGINNLTDIWHHKDVNSGNYASMNAGYGIRYNFTKRISLSYDMSFGYFTSDQLDYITSGLNDMYMQNCFSLGVNF